MLKKNQIIRILGLACLAASLFFLVRRILSLQIDFSALMTPTNIAMLSTMPFLTVIVILSNSYCWRMFLRLFTDRSISTGETFYAYAKANVMKYLPGNVGHYAGRQMYGSMLGVSQVHLVIASLMEIAYSAFSMILCAAAFSFQEFRNTLAERFTSSLAFLLAVGTLVCVCALLAAVRLRGRFPVVSELLDLLRSLRFWKTLAFSVCLFSLGGTVLVMENVVLIDQYVPMSFHQMFILISANFVSIFIGYVTPGVPGGIGVREAVMSAMLSSQFPGDAVLLAAFTHRMIMILGDALAVPVSALFVEGNAEELSNNEKEKP